ncbi:MAG: sodium:proton antiporter [Clostridia bacterium]|nr:sodium:proton antiporter [Clostridia bacterium]
MDALYELAMTIALVAAALGLFVCLFRAIKGPTTADRLIAINMTGTVVICMILILTILLEEGYLADIAIIYALLSFLAVVVLVRIFVALNRKKGKEGGKDA